MPNYLYQPTQGYPQPSVQNGFGAYQQPMAQPQQMASQDLIQVNGLGGAQNFQLAPNSRVALFDSNADIFYIKSTDAGGYPTIQAYQFMPVKNDQAQPTEYISRQEFEEFKNEVLNYGKQSIPKE